MAISIDWTTRIVTIPKADLTLVSGTLYELDTDAFRLELKGVEAAEAGIVHPDTHSHNTEYTAAGVTYARALLMQNAFSVEFEDGAYSVRLAGSNTDLFDVEAGRLVQNTVQVIPGNSAGLIVTESVDLTAAAATVAAAVWASIIEGDEEALETLRLLRAGIVGKSDGAEGTTMHFRDRADAKDRITATVTPEGNRTAVSTDAS